MNQIFKVKLIAILAVVFGAVPGICAAIQTDSNSGNDFGFVRLAKPNPEFAPDSEKPLATDPTVETQSLPPQTLPPIVSAADSAAFPPIVPAQEPEQLLPPISNRFGLLKPIPVADPTPDLLRKPLADESSSKPIILQATRLPMSQPKEIVSAPPRIIEPETIVPETTAPELMDSTLAGDDVSLDPTNLPPVRKLVSSAGVPIYPSESETSEIPLVEDSPPALVPMLPTPISSSSVLPVVTAETPNPFPPLTATNHRLVASAQQLNQDVPQAINQVYSPPSDNQLDVPPAITQVYTPPTTNQEYTPQAISQVYSPPMETPLVDPSFPPAPDYFTPQPGQTAPFGPTSSGCSCGGTGCINCAGGYSANDVAGCQSCGPGGCFNSADVAARFGDSGSVYSARSYTVIDLLYFTRNDGQVVFSNFGSATQFDSQAGIRVTYGTRADATMGREFSYLGSLPMEETFTRTDPLGRINSRILPGDGFGFAETSSFFNVVDQTLDKKTILQSIEFNRVKWGWDVVKTFIGIRYIYVEDELRVDSRNIFGDVGTFGIHSINNLVGPHVGSELFYDVGKRLSYSLVSKAGIYANPNKTDTTMTNAGVNYLGTEKYNQTISGSIEINLTGRFRLTRRSRFRFGYTGLWLGDVSTVSDNIPTTLTPSTGIDASDSDDMYFSAFSFGLEMFR